MVSVPLFLLKRAPFRHRLCRVFLSSSVSLALILAQIGARLVLTPRVELKRNVFSILMIALSLVGQVERVYAQSGCADLFKSKGLSALRAEKSVLHLDQRIPVKIHREIEANLESRPAMTPDQTVAFIHYNLNAFKMGDGSYSVREANPSALYPPKNIPDGNGGTIRAGKYIEVASHFEVRDKNNQKIGVRVRIKSTMDAETRAITKNKITYKENQRDKGIFNYRRVVDLDILNAKIDASDFNTVMKAGLAYTTLRDTSGFTFVPVGQTAVLRTSLTIYSPKGEYAGFLAVDALIDPSKPFSQQDLKVVSIEMESASKKHENGVTYIYNQARELLGATTMTGSKLDISLSTPAE